MEEITRNQETNQILIKDKLHFEDKLVYANSNGPQSKPHGMWARTEVIGGFGDFVRAQSPYGKSTLTDIAWHEENMVVLGGVQYTMENIFGEKCDQILWHRLMILIHQLERKRFCIVLEIKYGSLALVSQELQRTILLCIQRTIVRSLLRLQK